MVVAGYAYQSIGIPELRRNIDTAEKGSGNPGSFFYLEEIIILIIVVLLHTLYGLSMTEMDEGMRKGCTLIVVIILIATIWISC